VHASDQARLSEDFESTRSALDASRQDLRETRAELRDVRAELHDARTAARAARGEAESAQLALAARHSALDTSRAAAAAAAVAAAAAASSPGSPASTGLSAVSRQESTHSMHSVHSSVNSHNSGELGGASSGDAASLRARLRALVDERDQENLGVLGVRRTKQLLAPVSPSTPRSRSDWIAARTASERSGPATTTMASGGGWRADLTCPHFFFFFFFFFFLQKIILISSELAIILTLSCPTLFPTFIHIGGFPKYYSRARSRRLGDLAELGITSASLPKLLPTRPPASLTLSHNPLGAAGAAQLATWLRSPAARALRVLRIADTALGETGFSTVLSAIASAKVRVAFFLFKFF
jgi:hypothetical protein